MLPYYILLFAPLLFSLYAQHGRITVYNKIETKEQKWVIGLFFLVFILLVGLRGLACGSDTINYSYYFTSDSVLSLRAITQKYNIEIAFHLLNKLISMYARESVSQTVLKKSCNIDACLSNDLAMYLERDKKFDASMYLQSKGINIIPGRTVGITVRPYRFPESNNPEELYDNYKESVSELVIWLLEKEYYPVFIEHVYDDNYHERDIICINEISELLRLKGKHIDVFSDLSLNCKQLKAIYGAMDFVVGTRFHSVIFSLTELVPAVAITYGGNKGIGIMKDIGLSEYSVPISDISGEKLKTRVEDMILKKDDIKVKLEEFQRKSKQEYEKIVDAIKNKRLSTET